MATRLSLGGHGEPGRWLSGHTAPRGRGGRSKVNHWEGAALLHCPREGGNPRREGGTGGSPRPDTRWVGDTHMDTLSIGAS